MKVYRVQTAGGVGPYRMGSCNFWHHNTSAHPGPEQDGITYRGYLNKHFGFTSKAALRRWFNAEDRKQLSEAGARVVLFKNAKEVQVSTSRKQCVFNRKLSGEPIDVTEEFFG